MSLEQQLADAIVLGFEELGGDPQIAIKNALYHRTVDSWIQQETAKTAIAGGAEMAIPGLHALTIPAGISYLMHKMAYITWGIGTLKGAFVVETNAYSDLRNILTLWANGGYYNSSLLDYIAIDREAYVYALSTEGYALVKGLSESPRDDTMADTWRVLYEIATEFSEDERAQTQLKSVVSKQAVADGLAVAHARAQIPHGETLRNPIERRIGSKLALRLATQLSLRVPARFVVGFIPIAGAIVNAFFNAQTLQSVAGCAVKYYENRIQIADLA